MITNRKSIALFVSLCCLFLNFASSAHASEIDKTDVFVNGKEGYFSFRIPSLITTQKGTLLAICEGRKNSLNDHGDIDLILKRSTDHGQTWGPIELIHEEGKGKEVTIGNPCPVIDQKTGVIWMPFCRNNKDVLITFSNNDGRTWSNPIDITSSVKPSDWGWYATGPGVGIQLTHGKHAGRLVIPCDHREKLNGKWTMKSHIIYSDNHGVNWKRGGSADIHTDECQVVELSDGRLLLNMRNYWGRTGKVKEKGGMRAVAFSDDGGESWSSLTFDKKLVEPICQASLIRFDSPAHSKPLLIFSNPASSSKRHTMTVRVSKDEGKTWPVAKVLNQGPSGYSCLTVLKNGTIGCLFENGPNNSTEKITFTRMNVEELLSE